MATSTLMDLVKLGDADGVDALCHQDPALAASTDENGVSALMVSIYWGKPLVTAKLRAYLPRLGFFEACALADMPAVQDALSSNTELLNSHSIDGFSGLGFAAFFGHIEIAHYLLSKGAEVDNHSSNGLKVTPLGSAAAGGHGLLAELLLRNGAKVNTQQNGGFSPLHSACQNGDVEMVKLLLQAGADTNLKTIEGKSPIDMIEIETNPEIFRLLSTQKS